MRRCWQCSTGGDDAEFVKCQIDSANTMLDDTTIPNVCNPGDAAIAAAIGIEDLHVGRHYLRDEQRWRTGAIWIDCLWILRVQPSFHDHGAVGVVSAHGESFRETQPPKWIKAFLLSGDELVVQEIEADPLPEFAGSLPLLRKSNSMFLDGIGYELRVESLVLEGLLKFSNPEEPELIAVESCCWQLAETIAHKARNQKLIAFAKAWRGYLNRGPK